MFKKRIINKDANNDLLSQSNKNSTENAQKKVIKSGIDLRKDIQQMQSIISTKKQQQMPSSQNKNQKDQQTQKPQHSVFKTKKINKFTSHILKNLPTKTLDKQSQNISSLSNNQIQPNNQNALKPHLPQQQSNQNAHDKQLVRPILSNYGLLDKNHFKSTANSNQQVIEASQGRTHQQALMDYYIKKKMQQMTKTNNPSTNITSHTHSVHKQPEAWQQVLQIQKQYLTQEQKIKEYSMQEIQKKLQKLAQQTIKTQIQKRNTYLKDLLQNEYERMQYASKKELKIMKQDKQRIQKQLNSKYRDSGRRNFIENIKNQSF